jgi:hypothetical protein
LLTLSDELAAFPSGRHDDQIDALSRAFGVLIVPIKGAGSFEYYRRRAAELSGAAVRT